MRILVVEDEFLASLLLEEDLRKAGWSTVGPFASLAEARKAIEVEVFDFAVLDVNLNGEMVYPLADELVAREIPFIFLSGYAARDLPDRFREFPRVAKPYNSLFLHKEIERTAKRR